MFDDYHRWYYETQVWTKTTFLGVPCLKSVSDMWNYQEIIADLRPGLIVEFGAYNGGSALFLLSMARLTKPGALVLSVDVDLTHIAIRARQESAIQFLKASSTDPAVAARIQELRSTRPGPVFYLIDSDHRKPHVLAELEMIRGVTRAGDYVVVEDGNINGHPVMPGWGEGPWEALEEYKARYPDDYFLDEASETKFGWTFAPKGFLVRR